MVPLDYQFSQDGPDFENETGSGSEYENTSVDEDSRAGATVIDLVSIGKKQHEQWRWQKEDKSNVSSRCAITETSGNGESHCADVSADVDRTESDDHENEWVEEYVESSLSENEEDHFDRSSNVKQNDILQMVEKTKRMNIHDEFIDDSDCDLSTAKRAILLKKLKPRKEPKN